jgi:hypothetical protein
LCRETYMAQYEKGDWYVFTNFILVAFAGVYGSVMVFSVQVVLVFWGDLVYVLFSLCLMVCGRLARVDMGSSAFPVRLRAPLPVRFLRGLQRAVFHIVCRLLRKCTRSP